MISSRPAQPPQYHVHPASVILVNEALGRLLDIRSSWLGMYFNVNGLTYPTPINQELGVIADLLEELLLAHD